MTKKHTILLSISGERKILGEYSEKDVSFFKLDLKNPRFSHKKIYSEKKMEEEIWREKDVGILFRSIIESKGISEAIVAYPDGTIIEGNRRIVCLRKIKEKYSDDPNIFPKSGYTKIPTYVLPKDMDPLERDVFLARLHVSGKKEWKSLNQAEQIYNLKEKYKLTFDKITNLIGMSRGKVFQKYWAYSKTKDFLKKYPKEPLSKYSYFEEAYKKKDVRRFVDNDSIKSLFYKWIVEKKFDDTGAKDIRKLSLIMEKPRLFDLFQKEGIKKTYHKYQAIFEIRESFYKSLLDILSSIKSLPKDKAKEFFKEKEKREKLNELKKEIDGLIKKVGNKK